MSEGKFDIEKLVRLEARATPPYKDLLLPGNLEYLEALVASAPALIAAAEERDRLREALQQIANPIAWDEMGEDGELYTVEHPDAFDAQKIARAALAAKEDAGE